MEKGETQWRRVKHNGDAWGAVELSVNLFLYFSGLEWPQVRLSEN